MPDSPIPAKTPPIQTAKLQFKPSVFVRKSFDPTSKVKSSGLFKPVKTGSPLREKLNQLFPNKQ